VNVIKLKYVARLNPTGRKNYRQLDTVSFVPMEAVGEDGSLEIQERNLSEVSSGYTYFENNDVVLAKITPCFENGKATLMHDLKSGFGFGTTEFIVLRPSKNIDSKYLYYTIYSDNFRTPGINEMRGSAGQKRITNQYVGDYALPVMDVKEQRKIVKYLDTKTQTLEKILTAKNHTRTHLSELGQAIITSAVLGAGGVAMSTSVKNTWVGATPDHWKITKLSHVARIKTGGTPSRENLDYWTDGNIPWLASGEVNKGIITTVDNHITPLGMANSNATMLPVDTVMIALNGQGKTKGMSALLKVPATCNQSLAGIICDKDKLNPQYLYYYLKSKYSSVRGIKGEARDGLNLDIIGSIPVPLPPMEEQLTIIEQIERRVNKIDSTEVKLSESIKLLEEYRSSLISSVVGGKVEV
jgi:type I restriction enzyme S subunit